MTRSTEAALEAHGGTTPYWLISFIISLSAAVSGCSSVCCVIMSETLGIHVPPKVLLILKNSCMSKWEAKVAVYCRQVNDLVNLDYFELNLTHYHRSVIFALFRVLFYYEVKLLTFYVVNFSSTNHVLLFELFPTFPRRALNILCRS